MSVLLDIGLNLQTAAAPTPKELPDGATFGEVDYTPGTSNVSNGYQTFDLWIPGDPFEKPAEGWPVVLFVNLVGYTDSTQLTIQSDLIQEARDRGLAVASVTVTPVNGDPNITGKGLFWDPSEAGWATDDIPEKDLIWAIQKMRDNSAVFGINPNAIGVGSARGSYAESSVILWVAFEADHADSGAATTQEQQSSLPNAVYVDSAVFWNPAMQNSRSQSHLRDEGNTANVAATYGDASELHRKQASPPYRKFIDESAGANDIPILFVTQGTPTASGQYPTDADRMPTRTGTVALETDAWFGLACFDWLRYSGGTTSNNFHAEHSQLVSGAVLQFGVNDRIVTSTVERSFILSFFQSTLASWDGTAETFDVPFEWASDLTTKRRGLITQGTALQRRQAQKSYSRARQEDSIRSWRIGSRNATATDIARIQAILDATANGALPVNFPAPACPGNVPARFADSSFEYRLNSFDRYTYQLTFEEVL